MTDRWRYWHRSTNSCNTSCLSTQTWENEGHAALAMILRWRLPKNPLAVGSWQRLGDRIRKRTECHADITIKIVGRRFYPLLEKILQLIILLFGKLQSGGSSSSTTRSVFAFSLLTVSFKKLQGSSQVLELWCHTINLSIASTGALRMIYVSRRNEDVVFRFLNHHNINLLFLFCWTRPSIWKHLK